MTKSTYKVDDDSPRLKLPILSILRGLHNISGISTGMWTAQQLRWTVHASFMMYYARISKCWVDDERPKLNVTILRSLHNIIKILQASAESLQPNSSSNTPFSASTWWSMSLQE